MRICTIILADILNLAPDAAFQITKENLLKLNLDPWEYLEARLNDNEDPELCFRMPWELALTLDYSKEHKERIENHIIQVLRFRERGLFRPTPDPFWDGPDNSGP